jgi:hypothetical protein
LVDRFRCPDLPEILGGEQPSLTPGYFRFGSEAVCYGRCSSATPASHHSQCLPDVDNHVIIDKTSIRLPFDAGEVLDNLRLERYSAGGRQLAAPGDLGVIRGLYYLARPFLGSSVRRRIQRYYLNDWREITFPSWPVDRTVEEIFGRLLKLAMIAKQIDRLPFVWFWPDGAPTCTMMTHDVETSAGLRFCPDLMAMDDSFGIKSSFQIVPEERYRASASLLENIRKQGFEINIHDLKHDGNLWSDKDEFMRRAGQINSYGRQFGASGFRSAIMYRNTDWYDALQFSYDMSIPNVAHLDPQRGGCCTVLPFFIGEVLELPLTTIQDYSLFAILQDYSTKLWEDQISLIREKNGLISFIVHPDYIMEARARRVYCDLLRRLAEMRAQRETWIALPGEIDRWWRMRSVMTVAQEGGEWRVKGAGSERARVAFATLKNDSLTYEVSPDCSPENVRETHR